MSKYLFLSSCLLLTCLATRSLAVGQERAATDLPEAPEVLAVAQPGPASTLFPAQRTDLASAAQSSSQIPSSPQTSSSDDQLKQEEKQRLLGIMPAFNTVQSGSAAPLRPSQKLDLWFHSAIDPFTIGVAAIDGGIEQAENTYPEYGQGVEGFAKRFGASYADSVDGNFWGNAILPIVLHQDPRYFRLGQGSVKRRLAYAVLSTVRCKGDNGKWQPSYSNIGGNLIAGAISNLYYPASDRGVGLTLERGFTVTAEGALGSLAFEFYPDLVNHFKHRREQAAARKGGSTAASSAP